METSRTILRVNRKDIWYFRYILESYDGMAVVSTLDPTRAYIEIRTAPGCEDIVKNVVRAILKERP